MTYKYVKLGKSLSHGIKNMNLVPVSRSKVPILRRFWEILRRCASTLGFEQDGGKVSIRRGIEGQGINTLSTFTFYYQGGGVLPLSQGQKIFRTGPKSDVLFW